MVQRFPSVDPLAEIVPSYSSYSYTFNNPILFNDPTGMMGEKSTDDLIGDAWDKTPNDGRIHHYDNKGNKTGTSNPDEAETTEDVCCPWLDRKFDQQQVIKEAIGTGRNPNDAWQEFLDMTGDTELGVAAGQAIVFVGSWYVGGAVVGLVFKVGGRAVTVALGSKATPKGIAFLQKALKPLDEADSITLYRGTTGSEGVGRALFLTDDAAVAATYVKNGGKVIEGQFSRVQLQKLQWSDKVSSLTGKHLSTGKTNTEYAFRSKELIQAVLSIMK